MVWTCRRLTIPGITGLLMTGAMAAAQDMPTCCDQVRPPFYGAELEALDLSDGELFQIPSALGDVAGVGARLGGASLRSELSDPDLRAAVYSEAVLSALAAEQLTRLEPEAAGGISNRDLLTSLAGVTAQGATVIGTANDISESIRAIEAARAAGDASAGVGINTPLGRGASALGPVALAASLVDEFEHGADGAAFLGEAVRDARIAGALVDLEAVIRASPGYDPAMLAGVQDARARLVSLSESRLRRMAEAGRNAFDANQETIAALALAKIASGGAAIVAGEVLSLGASLDDFSGNTLSISAMHNLAAATIEQTKMIADGDTAMFHGLSVEDIDVRRLGAFQARLSAEASAATYTLLWTDRLDGALSVAGWGRKLGLDIAEALRAEDDLQARYRALVAERAKIQAELWRAAARPRPAPLTGGLAQLYLGALHVEIPATFERDDHVVEISEAMGEAGPWFYSECGMTLRDLRAGADVGAPCRTAYAQRGSRGGFQQDLNLARSRSCEVVPLDIGRSASELKVEAFTVTPPRDTSGANHETVCGRKFVSVIASGFSVMEYPVAVQFIFAARGSHRDGTDLEGIALEVAKSLRLDD